MAGALDTVHATAIAVNGRAALITGPSGAGKSDLALRCLTLGASPMLPHEARLIADDRVIIERVENQLMASAPAAISGKLKFGVSASLNWPRARQHMSGSSSNSSDPEVRRGFPIHGR